MSEPFGQEAEKEAERNYQIVKRLEERIKELDGQIVKIQNSNDDRNKSLAIHDAKYEQFILQKILEGKK